MNIDNREKLRQVRSFPSLVKYLRDVLDWPIDTEDFDDLTFDYEPAELGIDAKTAAKIDGIKQLRPLVTNQPWGIFFVKFEPKRLPVVALRRILGQLVFRKRAAANKAERPAWDIHDLLFISAFGEGDERQISFAHFSEDPHLDNLATLRVLGWDGDDTGLHIDHVYNELHDKLHWPDHPDDIAHWRARWSLAFTLRHREVIVTSKDLAEELADLARRIRRKVNAALRAESETGKLRKLMKAFQESLIHDLDDDDFADMYAQTIAYGLLSARVSRQSGALAADDVALMAPVTSPFLRELLDTFLNLGGRKRKANGDALDFDELGIADVVDVLREANMEAVLRDFDNRNPQEDPVVHFYELFLKEYDAKKRMQRGVFYTPKPVVSYIVRSVHELLQTEFGLPDGLADTTTWGEMAARNVDAASCRVDLAQHATRQDVASTLIQYFDPEEPIAYLSGNLPHWRQEVVTYFVTFRLADSLPQEKLRKWVSERDAWLKSNPEPHSREQRDEYNRLFTARFHFWLDQGYGSCILGKPDVKTLVESALRHFDGERYALDEFIVMPNHVHVLVTPLPGHKLSDILHSWKSFTANSINRLLDSSGTLWQKESFDHIVRSPESMEKFRQYIRENPIDAASSRAQGIVDERSTTPAGATTRQDAASTFQIPEGVSPDEPFVQIFDPALGTGTFLVEVIEVIHRTMTAKWRAAGHVDAASSRVGSPSRTNKLSINDLWNDYVPKHLLPRLYGFELLMAPYAIAHMKIGLKLAETGYRFQSDERARVYLTNSLEPAMPEMQQKQIAEMSIALAHEAKAVNEIKRHKRFTVVIGNPPYSYMSANLTSAAAALIEPFRYVDGQRIRERSALSLERSLQDDFVKFFGLALRLRRETGAAFILGFITNNSYMDSALHRGVRGELMRLFDRLYFVNLFGDSIKDREENVFDIQQGVAIFLGAKACDDRATGAFITDIHGTRANKYTAAQQESMKTLPFARIQPLAPHRYFLQLETAGEYLSLPSLIDVFQLTSTCIKTLKDDLATGFDMGHVRDNIEYFRNAQTSKEDIKARFGVEDVVQWKVEPARRAVRGVQLNEFITQYQARPFDYRWMFYHSKIVGSPRTEVMRNLLN